MHFNLFLVHRNVLILPNSLFSLFYLLHSGPQLIQKIPSLVLHLNSRNAFLPNFRELQIQLYDLLALDGLIAIKMYLLHLYLLAIQ